MPEREAGASGPITIDRTSPVPLYFQLAQYFESAIRSGALTVGARLENSAGLVQLNVEMLEQHGLYELLRASGIGPCSATQRIGAKNASASEARTLDETRGTALLTMERIACDQAGRPVEFARHLYRASRYAFTASFPRPEPVMG
jgi:DNA-binding GntR family transcriptional regulator